MHDVVFVNELPNPPALKDNCNFVQHGSIPMNSNSIMLSANTPYFLKKNPIVITPRFLGILNDYEVAINTNSTEIPQTVRLGLTTSKTHPKLFAELSVKW